MRRRLELGLAALLDHHFAIEPAPMSAPEPWYRRVARLAPVAGASGASAVPSTDGVAIRLPATLGDGSAETLPRLRALALVQAIRALRGAAAHAPLGDTATDRLARDLFALWDARASLLRARQCAPGLANTMQSLLTAERTLRPAHDRLTNAERVVDTAIRVLLDDAAASPVDGWPSDDATPARAAEWARGTAAQLLTAHRGRYRGLAPVRVWGTLDTWVRSAGDPHAPTGDDVRVTKALPPPSRLTRRKTPRGKHMREAKSGDPTHARIATSDVNRAPDDLTPTIDDARGAATQDPGASDPGQGLGDARSRVVPRNRDATVPSVEYPEWDAHAQAEREEGARVMLLPPDWRADRGAGWADRTVREQAGVIRRIRRLFEMLQPRRERLPHSRDGDTLDLDATVRAEVERRLGLVPSEDLFIAVKPARRPIAIVVLVDVSGSTREPVDGGAVRVIDVARTAALHAAEALDALGDPCAILAFSSYGRRDVEVEQLKGFTERHGATVRARIGALEPGGNTRLGAAIRHATALLSRQPTTHRLLLVVTDGKPNDADGYTGAVAVEDSRHALFAARALGVVPYALAVGSDDVSYLTSLFDHGGYAMLRNAERLPGALVGALRAVVARR